MEMENTSYKSEMRWPATMIDENFCACYAETRMLPSTGIWNMHLSTEPDFLLAEATAFDFLRRIRVYFMNTDFMSTSFWVVPVSIYADYFFCAAVCSMFGTYFFLLFIAFSNWWDWFTSFIIVLSWCFFISYWLRRFSFREIVVCHRRYVSGEFGEMLFVDSTDCFGLLKVSCDFYILPVFTSSCWLICQCMMNLNCPALPK